MGVCVGVEGCDVRVQSWQKEDEEEEREQELLGDDIGLLACLRCSFVPSVPVPARPLSLFMCLAIRSLALPHQRQKLLTLCTRIGYPPCSAVGNVTSGSFWQTCRPDCAALGPQQIPFGRSRQGLECIAAARAKILLRLQVTFPPKRLSPAAISGPTPTNPAPFCLDCRTAADTAHTEPVPVPVPLPTCIHC